MVFERRVDDVIDFNVIRLTEKVIWQALEHAGVAYKDWVAYKEPGQQVLQLFLELKDGHQGIVENIAAMVREQVTKPEDGELVLSAVHKDVMDMIGFNIKVKLLEKGAFADYTARMQAQGADPAHLKPPHINPSDEVLSLLLGEAEEIVVVKKAGAKTGTEIETKDETVNV
jgi:hypothetical protein